MNIYDVFTTREAEQKWGLAVNTVNKWCNRGIFSEEEARKSGGTWLVTRQGMINKTRRDAE